MITIGICDDDMHFVHELHNCLQEIMRHICDWQARIYKDGNEIITDISNGSFDCHLLFMDIYMQGKNGIEIARYFYEHHIDTDIIFITSSKKHVYECYRYHSFSYLLKPISKNVVSGEIQRYMSEITKAPKSLNIAIKNVHYRIPLRSITYLESDCRKIIVHTPYKDYEYYDKLDRLEEVLTPYGFIRCHQSFLVSDAKILSYQTGKLNIGDCEIPISNRYKERMEDLFNNTLHPPLSSFNPLISQSLSLNRGVTGALVCTKGSYLGSIIRFYANKEILIGRDGNICDIVINLPQISRTHCSITYCENTNTYEILDHSHNGTFVIFSHDTYTNKNCEPVRLDRDKSYIINPGSTIHFGDSNTIYRLI